MKKRNYRLTDIKSALKRFDRHKPPTEEAFTKAIDIAKVLTDPIHERLEDIDVSLLADIYRKTGSSYVFLRWFCMAEWIFWSPPALLEKDDPEWFSKGKTSKPVKGETPEERVLERKVYTQGLKQREKKLNPIFVPILRKLFGQGCIDIETRFNEIDEICHSSRWAISLRCTYRGYKTLKEYGYPLDAGGWLTRDIQTTHYQEYKSFVPPKIYPMNHSPV